MQEEEKKPSKMQNWQTILKSFQTNANPMNI